MAVLCIRQDWRDASHHNQLFWMRHGNHLHHYVSHIRHQICQGINTNITSLIKQKQQINININIHISNNFRFLNHQKLTIKLFGAMNIGAFGLIAVVTQFAVHGSLRVQVLGWICVSIAVSVFSAPLSIMVSVCVYIYIYIYISLNLQ